MDLEKFKPKGYIGIGAVYQRLQENPDKDFVMAFVRITEPKGSISVRTVRYGAPAYVPKMGESGLKKAGNRKKVKHDATGTIPVHYPGTKEYRSILVSHLIMFDGYLVNL